MCIATAVTDEPGTPGNEGDLVKVTITADFERIYNHFSASLEGQYAWFKAGIDAAGLEETVRRYNTAAERGEDPEFHRGSTAFNRFLGDPAHKPNPNVAPVKRGPFYAVKLYVGDLGTFNGIRTDAACRVLGEEGRPVPGLYALGNDAASIMGGNYPGAGITLGPHLTFGYVLGHHLAGRDVASAEAARPGRETAGAVH